MALSPRLELRQGQGLVITPQLQQAIKLLQLSSTELDAYLEGELERNPLLQREDGPEGGADGDSEPEPKAESKEFNEVSLDEAPDSAAADAMDATHADLYSDASPGERSTGDGGAVLIEAPLLPLVAARRKALTLGFARLAAMRAMGAPAVGLEEA